MKTWIPVSIVLVTASLGAASPVLAQPRQPAPDARKSAPDAHRDGRDDHKSPPDARKDPRDDHKDPPEARRGTAEAPPAPINARQGAAGDARERFIQLQNQERERRKDARKDAAAWAAGRQKRAAEDRKEITATWGSLSSNAEAKAELTAHAERMARLNRVLDLAEDRSEPTVTARAKTLIEREITRHTNAMTAIKAKVGAR
jgi:hypothetical protein